MKPKSCFIFLAMLLSCSINAQDKFLSDSIKILYDGNYGLSIIKNLNTEKHGIIDRLENIILAPTYDYIYPFYYKLALVYDGNHCGFLNLKGELEIPLEYTTGNHFKKGKAVMTKNFVSGVIDTSNNIVIPFKYDALQTNDHTTYHFRFKPTESGLMDSQEKIILEPIYDRFMSQNDSLWVVRKDNKFSILKNDGASHCPIAFDQLGSKNSANLRRFSTDKKIGFLDEHFNIAVPAEYSGSGPAIGQMVAVYKDGKCGFVDRSNTRVTEFIYDRINGLSDEACVVIKDGLSNIMDKNGHLKLEKGVEDIRHIEGSDLIYIDGHLYDKEINKKTTDVVRLSYEQFSGMHIGMLQIYVDNQLGYVDSLGNMKIAPYYDEGSHFHEEDCASVKKDGKWGFINSNNEPISAMIYDKVSHFGSYNKCNYITTKGDLYGFVKGNKVVFEPQFQEIIVGTDESITYRKGDKYGLLDIENSGIGKAKYDQITSTYSGYVVEKKGKFGFLDKSFKTIIPLAYEYLEDTGYYFIAKLNGKFGTISEANETIQDFVYDHIERKPLKVLKIFKNGKVGTLSTNGRELLPPIYDDIKKVNWKSVEVSIGEQTEIINIAKLEMENLAKEGKQ